MNYPELGLKPVTESNPPGVNVRYETIYDELQTEIDKLNSPSSHGSFDWQKVILPASIILKSHSKDLLVASYLGIALSRSKGVVGMVQATELICNLLHSYWDTLYPEKKRIQGRVSALEYWIDQTLLIFESENVFPFTTDQSDTICNHMMQIELLLGTHKHELNLDDIHSRFHIRKLIESVRNTTEKTVNDANEKQGSEPFGIQVESTFTSDTPVKDSAPFTSEDSLKIIKRNFQEIKQVVRHIRKENPEDPRPYRWARISIWDTIDILPPAEDGKTKIPPPPENALKTLGSLYEAGEWRELLNQSEVKISNPQYLFCFDLTRYTAEALKHLGGLYEKARKQVCSEMLNLINRFPNITECAFSNGKPFADEQTRDWIQDISKVSEVSSGQEDDLNQAMDSNSCIDDEIQMVFRMARDKKNIKTAVSLMQQSMNKCHSGKDTFLWKIGLVELLCHKNNRLAAVPHANGILENIKQYSMDIWDPDLAFKGYKTALKVFKGLKEYQEKTHTILNEISLIDASEILKTG